MSERNSSKKSAAGKSVPEEVYLRHVQRARAAGNWFLFCRDYVTSGAMNRLQALFLQDLINLAGMAGTKKDDQGYFLCTVEYLTASLTWDKEQQKRLLRTLGDGDSRGKPGRGFLTTKYAGVPPRRWIKLDLLAIEKAVDFGLDGGPD